MVCFSKSTLLLVICAVSTYAFILEEDTIIAQNVDIFAADNALPSLSRIATRTRDRKGSSKSHNIYEVWGSDQSNSVPSQDSLGVAGGFLWIWNSRSIKNQIVKQIDAIPESCLPGEKKGPCDMISVFPSNLKQFSSDGATGKTLGELNGFGRLHGVIKDPSNRYVVVNMFAPSGGYVGIMDTQSKEAVGLFRITLIEFSGTTQRSVHMSIWSSDGSSIIISNLHGKTLERINVRRKLQGDTDKIIGLSFDTSASIGLGNNQGIEEGATFFLGKNAFQNELVTSKIIGTYEDADFGSLTPNNVCKENGCNDGNDGAAGGRPNNMIICPIPSENNLAYTSLAGGGLLIIDLKSTPMSIKGEYGKSVVYGAGCGGVQANGQMFMNAGVSASGPGSEQSMFAVYSFDDSKYSKNNNRENHPMPKLVFQDKGNTISGGNLEGNTVINTTGQKPSTTTRRDSHGMVATVNGKYIHVADRIQNVMEVFDVTSHKHVGTYDLVSASGKNGREGPSGPCYTHSVLDDGSLSLNDPAPDLMDRTPDGKYLMVAFRGPAPVSVSHAAQGSCPGVGIIKILEGGKSGKLVDVLRSSNTLQDNVTINDEHFSIGHPYQGKERSDMHGSIVVTHRKF